MNTGKELLGHGGPQTLPQVGFAHSATHASPESVRRPHLVLPLTEITSSVRPV
ncbi:hypothetical protein [Rothia sp. P100]|uniref:hypothetical protein n=1 Tax=Rothia sp. P100 TaxID=2939578 RepID=UPI00203F9E7A|nr:hypothetical protein [Rothia sp. P100]